MQDLTSSRRWGGRLAAALFPALVTASCTIQVIEDDPTPQPCDPGVVESCYSGPEWTAWVGTCQTGTRTCRDDGTGWEACVGEVTPQPETVDGLDNDCDGVPDDGIACNDGDQRPCFAGQADVDPATIQLPCQAGTQLCVGGQWADQCVSEEPPHAEVCNGIDDDCNGEIDDGQPGAGLPCMIDGVAGPCQAGITVCTPTGLVCQQEVFPVVELCNGLDDNCDGVPDNNDPQGGAICMVIENPQPLGECAVGEITCEAGQQVCQQVRLPVPETCNGLDDDCNGFIDNGSFCCPDGVKNGAETDVDCGGPCQQKCAPSQVCLQHSDCASGVCDQGACQP